MTTEAETVPPEQEPHSRAMVVFAHPDDADWGCSGTVAKWTRLGWEVVYVMCTDGSKGTEDRSISATQLSQIRKQEQIEGRTRARPKVRRIPRFSRRIPRAYYRPPSRNRTRNPKTPATYPHYHKSHSRSLTRTIHWTSRPFCRGGSLTFSRLSFRQRPPMG